MGEEEAHRGPSPPRRAPLTRDAVLDAALDVIDRRGADALSMRGLAEELGVTPMALYNHVEGKQALLTGVVERVAAEMVAEGDARTWVARVRGWCRAIRSACLAHPNVVPLLQSTESMAPELLRPMEEVLAALAEAGLPPREALEVWSALVGLTMGQVNYQLGGHLRLDAAPAALDERFGRIRESHESGPFDFDRAFERSLDLFLRGLRERLRFASS